MKVGDTVFIVSDSQRLENLTGIQRVTKVGRKYFEIENTPWEKFIVNVEKEEHPHGDSSNRGVRMRDDYNSTLYWYPSEEAYKKLQEAKSSRNYISNNLHLMDDDEVVDFAKLLAEKEAEYVVRRK